MIQRASTSETDVPCAVGSSQKSAPSTPDTCWSSQVTLCEAHDWSDLAAAAAAERGTLMNLLMKVKEESEEVGLKLSIQKAKIMASGPITSWQIDGETVTDLVFLGSKITADGDYSHEIKTRLFLGMKAMTNLDSILKAEALLCQQRSI